MFEQKNSQTLLRVKNLMSLHTLYVYSLETDRLETTIEGETNQECEDKANEEYGSNDYYWSYSPQVITESNR